MHRVGERSGVECGFFQIYFTVKEQYECFECWKSARGKKKVLRPTHYPVWAHPLCALTETEEEWSGQALHGHLVSLYKTFCREMDWLLLHLFIMTDARQAKDGVLSRPLLLFLCLSSQVLMMSHGPHKWADHHPVMHTAWLPTFIAHSNVAEEVINTFNVAG